MKKAAHGRAVRAKIKKQFAEGEITITEILESDDEAIGRMRVFDLIQTMPGYGKAKTAKLMDEYSIAQNRRIRGPGKNQIEKLLLFFGKEA